MYLKCLTTQVYNSMPIESTLEASEMQTSLYSRHALLVPMVAALEGLYCSHCM